MIRTVTVSRCLVTAYLQLQGGSAFVGYYGIRDHHEIDMRRNIAFVHYA
jgi:hypothetical protein